MAVVFCPSELAFGSVADWVAIGVAILGAGAVFYLGWRANSIAQVTRQLAEESEAKEARGILGYIKGETGASERSARNLANFLEDAFRNRTEDAQNPAFWADLNQRVNSVTIQTLLESRGRAHSLPAGISDVAFRLMGIRRALQTRSIYLSNNAPDDLAAQGELKQARDWAQLMVQDLDLLLQYVREEDL